MNETAPDWPRFHAGTWYIDPLEVRAYSPPIKSGDAARTVIIGGGLAGLSTALSLAERGETDIALLERGEPGEGASGRNGGFVFGGYSLDPEKMAGQLGEASARRMHRWTVEAVRTVAARCRRLGVSISDHGVLLADWFGDDEALARHQRRMHDLLDFDLDWVARKQMPDYVRSARYGAGLYEPGSFHFNPKAYAQAIADRLVQLGIRVHTQTRAIDINRRNGRWRVATPDAEMVADRVVLATGGYERRLLPRIQRSIQPIATYVVVTEPLGDRLRELIPGGVAVYDTRFAFDYYRPLADSRLLWGGRISTADRDPSDVRRLMRRDIARVFPDLAEVRFDYAWGGWMSYALHQMPILRESEEGLWLALAFGGHGMAPTALAGELLAEALLGDGERLGHFDAYRPDWAGGPIGRAAVQGIYWWKQLRDRLRAAGRPAPGQRR